MEEAIVLPILGVQSVVSLVFVVAFIVIRFFWPT